MRKGLSLLEVIIALAMLMLAFMALHLSYRHHRSLALQTRQRAAAVLLAQTLLEEVRAHPFGTKAPADWEAPSRPPLEFYVDGRAEPVTLRPSVTCKTGAFVGKAAYDVDEVTITVAWDNPGRPSDKLEVTVPAWRE